MPRVVGCDPGTSSLDLLLWVDGVVVDQARLSPSAFPDPRGSAQALRDLLHQWAPCDLIAGPSGYGVPLVPRTEITAQHRADMVGLRADEQNQGRRLGVIGLRHWLDTLCDTDLPIVFLPGGYHLPTIPAYRKFHTIDLGTPDKVAVAALALEQLHRSRRLPYNAISAAVMEIGSAFTSILVLDQGQLVDASAGSKGPVGLRSPGAWDGEFAYARSPLSKQDLFRGGALDHGPAGFQLLVESVVKQVAGLHAITPFPRIILSGAGCTHAALQEPLARALQPLAHVDFLHNLPGAWVKHAAQGAALIADGLAGGPALALVQCLQLQQAEGSCWGPAWRAEAGAGAGETPTRALDTQDFV